MRGRAPRHQPDRLGHVQHEDQDGIDHNNGSGLLVPAYPGQDRPPSTLMPHHKCRIDTTLLTLSSAIMRLRAPNPDPRFRL